MLAYALARIQFFSKNTERHAQGVGNGIMCTCTKGKDRRRY